MLLKPSNMLKTAFTYLSPIAFLFSILVSQHAAAAAVVIDFATGFAGPGGTITESGGHVVGEDINISLMILDGTAADDGSHTSDALLSFATLANTISICGTIDPFAAAPTTLLWGTFDWFNYSEFGGHKVFQASGLDMQSAELLTAIGLPTDTTFDYFGFSIESINGSVMGTDIVNTAVVPLPAAARLLGSALLRVGVMRRKTA